MYAAILAAGAAGLAGPAAADTAVAYGARTVHVLTEAADREAAIQGVLETCSQADTHCRIALKCSEPGHGAAAAAEIQGFIDAIGAVCGRNTPESARAEALALCGETVPQDACRIRAQWVE